MTLKILGSSSDGNGYLLSSPTETLIIEAGVKLSETKQALNFNLRNVVGLICSHPSHNDHGGYIKDYLNAGIACYSGAGEWAAINVQHHRAHAIQAGKVYKLGSFEILPFTIIHDTPEPLGFLIRHPEIGTTLFVTDTCYLPNRFKGLNNLLIECNHCTDIIRRKYQGDELASFLRNRIIASHMSLQTLKEVLKANDLSRVNSITLIHLSSSNSDAALFKSTIEAVTGIETFIADAGVTINNYGTPGF